MSALALEPPLSPELVLVSPPEEAELARRRLPDPPAPPLRSAPRARRLAVSAFWALCVANSLAPFVFAMAVAR